MEGDDGTVPSRAEAASLGIWCSYDGALHVPTVLGERVSFSSHIDKTPTGFAVTSDGDRVHVMVPTEADSDVWLEQRERWVSNVKLWQHIQETRKVNWLGLATALPPPREVQTPSSKPLTAGEPVGLLEVEGYPDLKGKGAILIESLGNSGAWRVQPRMMGEQQGGDALPEAVTVEARSFGPLPNWPFVGVTLACLRAFRDAHVAQLGDEATTELVCDRIIKPLTQGKCASLAACLQQQQQQQQPPPPPQQQQQQLDIGDSPRYVGPPTAFISHARGYHFVKLVDAIEAFSQQQSKPEEEQFFWLDIFCQYQHWIGEVGTIGRPCNWDVTFQLTIAAIGHTCLVLSPWRDPLPLRRAWILWEMLCTLESDGVLTIELPTAESSSLYAALIDDFEAIRAAVADVDSRAAECYTADDQVMIHAAIGQTVGHTALNARVTRCLNEWMCRIMRQRLDEMRATSPVSRPHEPTTLSETELLAMRLAKLAREQLGDHQQAEALLLTLCEERRRHAASPLEGALRLIAEELALTLESKGSYTEAEALYEQMIVAARQMNDAGSLGTALGEYSYLLLKLGRYTEAEPGLREAMAIFREMGESKAKSLLGLQDALATLLQFRRGGADDITEAVALRREVLDAERKLHGRRHPRTNTCLSNLATILRQAGLLEEAEPVYEEALELSREVHGARHPSTLATLNNYSQFLVQLGRLDEAGPLLHELVAGTEESLGPAHPNCVMSKGNLAKLLRAQAKYAEAESVFREVVDGFRTSLGLEHEHTKRAERMLAEVRQERVETESQAHP
jgi:tetratricopeptide (TPR) repeat protein